MKERKFKEKKRVKEEMLLLYAYFVYVNVKLYCIIRF